MNAGSVAAAGGGGPLGGGGVDGGVITGGAPVAAGIAIRVGFGRGVRGGSSGVGSSSEDIDTPASPASRCGGGGADGTDDDDADSDRHGGVGLKATAPSFQLVPVGAFSSRRNSRFRATCDVVIRTIVSSPLSLSFTIMTFKTSMKYSLLY